MAAGFAEAPHTCCSHEQITLILAISPLAYNIQHFLFESQSQRGWDFLSGGLLNIVLCDNNGYSTRSGVPYLLQVSKHARGTYFVDPAP